MTTPGIPPSASSRPRVGRAVLMSARPTVETAAAVRDRGRSARVAETTIAGRVSRGTLSGCCAARPAGTSNSQAHRMANLESLRGMPEEPVPAESERREPHAEIDQRGLPFDVRPGEKAPEPGIVAVVPVVPHYPEAVGGDHHRPPVMRRR